MYKTNGRLIPSLEGTEPAIKCNVLDCLGHFETCTGFGTSPRAHRGQTAWIGGYLVRRQ
jgi:hypothetical protein